MKTIFPYSIFKVMPMALLGACMVVQAAAPARAWLEPPAKDYFGADEQIQKRSYHLMPDECPPLPNGDEPLKLMDVINLSLCHNPDTKASWLGLRSSALSLNSTKINAYLPSVSASASLAKSTAYSRNGTAGTRSISESSGASASLGYTLFDFGRRELSIESAERALTASAYGFDSSLQGAIASALQRYYSVLSTQGSYAIAVESLKLSKETLKAARLRYDLGMVPKSDLLQAESSYSQAELGLNQSANQLKQVRIDLASIMGLPPQTQLEVAEIDDSELARDNLDLQVDKLMDAAQTHRLDLAASEEGLKASRANLKSLKRNDLPTVSVSASHGYSDIDVTNSSTPRSSSIGVSVSIPIFTGLTRRYSIKSAEYSLEAQELGLERSRLNVMQDVWRAYTNYQTAQQSWMVSWDFLSSATQLRDVTLERYKEGIGSMLDVLSAQNQYASAAQRQIDARYSLLTSRADLVRAIGVLSLDNILPGNDIKELEETGK